MVGWEHPSALRQLSVLTVRVVASVRKRRGWLDRNGPSNSAIVDSCSTGASPLGVPSALDGGAEIVLRGGNPAISPNRSPGVDATEPPTVRTAKLGFRRAGPINRSVTVNPQDKRADPRQFQRVHTCRAAETLPAVLAERAVTGQAGPARCWSVRVQAPASGRSTFGHASHRDPARKPVRIRGGDDAFSMRRQAHSMRRARYAS